MGPMDEALLKLLLESMKRDFKEGVDADAVLALRKAKKRNEKNVFKTEDHHEKLRREWFEDLCRNGWDPLRKER